MKYHVKVLLSWIRIKKEREMTVKTRIINIKVIWMLIIYLSIVIFGSVYSGVILHGRDNIRLLGIGLFFLLCCSFWVNIDSPKTVFRSIFLTMFIVQLFLGYFLMVRYSTWDVYTVVKSARLLGVDKQINIEYFARYPNNIGLLLIFSVIFRVTNMLFDSMSVYFWLF